jgi:hypothetical protein
MFIYSDDFVYMYEEKLLKEYILNETGKIYSGSYKKISPKPWVFGQVSVSDIAGKVEIITCLF